MVGLFEFVLTYFSVSLRHNVSCASAGEGLPPANGAVAMLSGTVRHSPGQNLGEITWREYVRLPLRYVPWPDSEGMCCTDKNTNARLMNNGLKLFVPFVPFSFDYA